MNYFTKRLCHSQFQGPELYHHGILGMHWGQRNGPPYPLSATVSNQVTKRANQLSDEQQKAIKNLRGARTANLDKFGKTKDNNILFIAGYSGSGKSTTALGFKRRNDHVIHLDAYSEPETRETLAARNKKLDRYLDVHADGWRKMSNASNNPKSGEIKRHGDEYWKIVDRFQKAVEDFSKEEFKKGNRVIVEGVQLADDWFAPSKDYYNGKPVIILQTGPIKSMRQAFNRDDRGGLIKGLANLDSAKDYIKWYVNSSQRLSDLSKSSNAKRGQEYLDKILDEIGNYAI